MNEFFLKILNMSISASWIILVVLILRLLLKKAPKWVNVLLWGIVAVRLICPFTIESAMSLMPSTETISSKTLSSTSNILIDTSQTSNDTSKDMSNMSQTNTDASQDVTNPSHDINNSTQNGTNSSQNINNSTQDGTNSFQDITDTGNKNTSVPTTNNTTNPTTQQSTTSIAKDEDINVPLSLTSIFSKVWIVGIILMVTYSAISYIRLKNKIGTAVLLRNNIYQSESVVSPFVLGVIKPKIYLPFNLIEQNIEPVIAHEQAHIKRKDYLWKPLGFIILTLHWFNPLVWLGYILLCQDIELACDEKAIKDMTISQRADYSQALLTCSVNRRMIAACPIAFGEVNVKNRIKSVLNYKKPTFWIIVISIIASIIVAICFLTNPVSKTKNNKNDTTTENNSTEPSSEETTTETKQPTEQTTSNKTSYSANDERYDFIRDNYNINGTTHELLIDVFLRNAEFIDTDNDGNTTTLSEYKLADGSDYKLQFYSVLDVDKDGYNEMFVRQANDTYVVFRYENNHIYSYQIPSEILLNVDGLMRENETYFIPKFSTNGYTKKVLAYGVKKDGTDTFYIGDKTVSHDTYVQFTTGSVNEKNAYKFYFISDLGYFPIAEKKSEEKFVKDYKANSYVPQEIVDVILYDKEFTYNTKYYESDKDNVTKVTKMSEFKDTYGSDPEKIRGIKSYVPVDIDQDGYSEVVAYMEYGVDDEVIIFHFENGKVYGYNFVFRAALDIAPGGYLHGSSGSADNDTYTIIFNKDKYTTKEKCGTDSDGTYYVDEAEVSADEYSNVSNEIWGKGELQEYETVLLLLELTENKQPTDETNEKVEPLQSQNMDKSTYEPNGKTPQLLKDVVLSKAEFTFVETELVLEENHDYTSKKIAEWPMLLSKYNYWINQFEDEVLPMDRYCVIDLNEDGYNEILLHHPVGWLILHYEDNKVYGFHYFERGMMPTYTSGMFSGSGGASYSTFSTMSFDKDSFKVTHHAIWDEEKVTIEGKETTQDEYLKYLHSGKFDYMVPYYEDLEEIVDIK